MKYTTTTVAQLPSGSVVGLTEAQYKTRSHALKAVKQKGWYLVMEPIQFKMGETFLCNDDLPKNMAVCAEAEAQRNAKAAKAKADAEAKALREQQESLAAFTAEAQAVWDKDETLRAKFSDFDAYLADVLKAG